MLIALNIQNYALIEQLVFTPTQGLTVITGETGAGKSIIMGALGLILGQRADAKTVRNGAAKCVIEATFDISDYHLESFFMDNDLEYDAHGTIIRREISSSGKSRAFVNDVPVQLNILKSLGDSLIDIHSQHQNLLIGQSSFQQEVVDTLAQNQKERDEYTVQYKELLQMRHNLKVLQEASTKGAQEADFLRFQLKQLEEAQLKEGEQEELEEEQEMLSHAEEIKESLMQIASQLDNEEMSVLQTIKRLSNEARNLKTIYPTIGDMGDRLESDFIDLKDIADDVAGQAEDINFDPARFEYVEDRLSQLYNLLKKHGKKSVSELISLRDEMAEKLQHIDNSDEEITELETKITKQTALVESLAAALTLSRNTAARKFEQELVNNVAYLGMPNVRFEVQISALKDFSASGKDEIIFLFSANKNQALKPAGEVASGGEISRLMLSIKVLIANTKTLPTIIFDEIDTGVSGDIADRMGDVMKQISKHLQVITITHLPQVAGKGDAHFKVFKEDSETETTTHIYQLTAEERINEIARMLSGSQVTEQAIANAKTLIL